MAITTQNPNLQLVGGQLGSQERLEAGAFDHIARRGASPTYMYLALFCGPRPSQEEIGTGNFTFVGHSSTASAEAHCIGIFRFRSDEYVELSAVPEMLRDTNAVNDALTTPRQRMPADPADMVDTGSRDLMHLLFNKHQPLSGTRIKPYYIDGRENGATWGLLCNVAIPSWSFDYLMTANTAKSKITRHDGVVAYAQTRSVLSENYSHYVTIGDAVQEPTANVTLHKGAERGLTTQSSDIRIHRIRLRLNALAPQALGV
jgi:hypothetical protein